jgi:hypothetical protein
MTVLLEEAGVSSVKSSRSRRIKTERGKKKGREKEARKGKGKGEADKKKEKKTEIWRHTSSKPLSKCSWNRSDRVYNVWATVLSSFQIREE